MWANCGVVREETRLESGLKDLEALKARLKDVDVRPNAEGYRDLALALDLRGALVAAEATLLSARARRESRGAHQRVDFPGTDPALQVNFAVRMDETGALIVNEREVPPVPEAMRVLLENVEEFSTAGRLLE